LVEVKRRLSSISVIIPACNAEETLEKCLGSVVQASPQEKEIIVVDDGSTDRTYKIASRFPVKLLHLDKNSGRSTAKNVGLAQATGDIVAFVDSDCAVEKSYFEELVSALNIAESKVGGVGGIIYPLESNLVSDSFRIRFFGCSPSNETKIRDTDSLSGGASAYPKELLSEIGWFDTSFRGGEDLDMSVRVRKAGYRLLIVPFAKVYHLHPTLLRHIVKKWFLYGEFLVDVSLKNNLKRDLVLSWGWVSSCLAFSIFALYTGQLYVWLLFLLAFCLPWILYYSRQTVKFWIRTRKIKYMVFPFIHQIVIISRSLGVIVATVSRLFKA